MSKLSIKLEMGDVIKTLSLNIISPSGSCQLPLRGRYKPFTSFHFSFSYFFGGSWGVWPIFQASGVSAFDTSFRCLFSLHQDPGFSVNCILPFPGFPIIYWPPSSDQSLSNFYSLNRFLIWNLTLITEERLVPLFQI